jgi:dihydrolipoamide dehydrogenase
VVGLSCTAAQVKIMISRIRVNKHLPSLITLRNYSTYDKDVVFIGGGPGGYVASIKASQLGLKTVCVEKRGALGGTCGLVGCIPSKALLHGTHIYKEIQASSKWGITLQEPPTVDLQKLMEKKKTTVNGLARGVEFLFKKYGVQYSKGRAVITGKNEVTVLDPSTGTEIEKISTKNIVIATGSEPTPLPFLPFDEKIVCSSTGILDLTQVPKRLIVVGAGVIGLELGSVWSRLGSQVTVVEFLDRITPFEDPEVSKTFQQLLTKQGIQFKLNTKVTGAKKHDNGVTLTVESKAGEKEELSGDVLLVSIGRRPYTANLGLENVGVKLDERGRVQVDPHTLQVVGSDNISAIGDVIIGPMLAHKAEEEGVFVAERLAGRKGHVNYDTIPSVIYTYPEVAHVGLNEEELTKKGVQYKVGKFPMVANSRAKTNDETMGFVKVLADKDTDRVLGVHIVGPNAGEQISECVLAMEYGASSEDIGRTCHAHPTLSEAVKEAANIAAFGKTINF